MITATDMKHLRRSVELAKEALEKGDQPFGSVLVSKDGEVLFEDHNHISEGDYTQHPEFNIARWAGQNLPENERAETTVYTSGEHCPMCSAAHGMVGLGRIVYVSSSKQFSEWKEEFGVEETARIHGFPIEEMIVDAKVEGPVPELAAEVKELHKQYFEK